MAETREMIRYKLPYGGAVDIRGKITWRVTKEEYEEMKKSLEIIFNEDNNGC
jgi:hypothetical protein